MPLAIVVPFLCYYRYGLFLPESLGLMAGAIAIGAVLGALALAGSAIAVATMVLVLAAYLFLRPDVFDLCLDAANALGAMIGSPIAAVIAIGIALLAATTLLCLLLRQHLDAIVAAVFGTMVVTSLLTPGGSDVLPKETGALPAHPADLPPVVHIVLDEHIGLAGVPSGMDGADAARRAITTTFADFALYGHAFSRFAETKYSLAALLNGDPGSGVTSLLKGDALGSVLQRNRWFERLKSKGYAIKVYQSDWLDLCARAPVDACYDYPLFSLHALAHSSLSPMQRLHALVMRIVGGNGSLQLEPLVSQDALDQLRRDIADHPRGVAYFVHLLVPHHGYLFGESCALRDPSEWRWMPDHDSAEERAALYPAYLAQLACADSTIAGIVAELKTLGVYDDAMIIVHGDHGSRIATHRFIGPDPRALSPADTIDHFSTLLAIKAPGVSPGIRDAPVALQSAFAETFLGGAGPNAPPPGRVFMRTSEDGESFAPLGFAWPQTPLPLAIRGSADEIATTGAIARRR